MTVPSLENGSLSGVTVAVLVAVVLICAVVYWLRLQLRWRGRRYDGPRTTSSYCSKKFRTESDGPNRSTPALPLKFHTFIRRGVIDHFNEQRVQRDQFAVLLFIDQGVDLKTNIDTNVRFYPTDIRLTHADYPFWPKDKQNFGNFMVARPEPSLSKHAEEILLEHFPKIWDVYQQREGQSPKYVILYSWTMPCANRCTPKLIRCINSSNKYTDHTKFIVAYTIHWCKENILDTEQSKKSLRDRDVIVEWVKYDKKLCPSSEEQRRASVTPPPMPEAEGDLNLHDEDEWPSLTKKQKIE